MQAEESTSVTAEARQAIVDDEHLRLLAIAHYISGGLCIAFASMFIFHFVLFFFFAANPDFFPPGDRAHSGPGPGLFRAFAIAIGVFILLGWSFGALTIYVGRCIKRRAHHTLALVVACVNLLFIPIGTLLGIATIVVLVRPSVKALYTERAS